IRDFHVTGVQTCALPISTLPRVFTRWSTNAGSGLASLNCICTGQLSSGTVTSTHSPGVTLINVDIGSPGRRDRERACHPHDTLVRAVCCHVHPDLIVARTQLQ